MKLDDLQLFLDVCKVHSFAKAAQQKSIPTSTISRRIAELEKQLGFMLFVRSKPKLTLTEQGMLYFNKLRPMLDAIQHEINELSQNENELTGFIRLSCPTAVANTFLNKIICDFKTQHPKVKFHCFLASLENLAFSEALDLVILPHQPKLNNWINYKLASTPIFAVASPSYLGLHDPIQHLDDLTNHTLLSFRTEPYFEYLASGRRHRFERRADIMITDPIAISQICREHHGIAFLPQQLIDQDLKEGHLVRVLPEINWGASELFLLFQDRELLPTAVRTFIEFLKSQILQNERKQTKALFD